MIRGRKPSKGLTSFQSLASFQLGQKGHCCRLAEQLGGPLISRIQFHELGVFPKLTDATSGKAGWMPLFPIGKAWWQAAAKVLTAMLVEAGRVPLIPNPMGVRLAWGPEVPE